MKLFLRSIAFLIVATFTSLASAQQLDYYIGGPNGDFNATKNWTLVAPNIFVTAVGGGTGPVPGATNIAVINPNLNFGNTLTATITQNGTGNTIYGLQIDETNGGFFFGGGTVDFINGGPTFLTIAPAVPVSGGTPAGDGDINAGDLDIEDGDTLTLGGTGTVNVTNGRIVVGDNLDQFISSGTLNINGGTLNATPSTGNKTETNIGSGFGATGTVNQGTLTSSANVITGNWFYIGVAGGTGVYNLTSGNLSTGVNGSIIGLGVNTDDNTPTTGAGATRLTSNGSLNILGNLTSSVNIGSGTMAGQLLLGTNGVGFSGFLGSKGGTGSIFQDDPNSSVNIVGASKLVVGNSGSSTGTYLLQAGSLNISGTSMLIVGNSAPTEFIGNPPIAVPTEGTLTQSGGTLTVTGATSMIIGNSGSGFYSLAGGSASIGAGATDGVTITVGADPLGGGTGTGIFSQAGGGLVVGNTAGFVAGTNTTKFNVGNIAGTGTGSFTISGGAADINAPLTIFANGAVNIDGGTLTIAAVNLKAGAPGGALNFGGGTLVFAADPTPLTPTTSFTDTFTNTLNNSTSTIDASLSSLATFNFTNPLTGSGGMNLIGNGTTVFTFASDNNPNSLNTNLYSGITGITAGTLNAVGADIQNPTAFSSALDIGSGGTLNLTLAAAGLDYQGNVIGSSTTGVLNVIATAPSTFEIAGLNSNFAGTVNLTNGATLQISSGTLGNVTGTGGFTVGGDNLVATSGIVNIGAGNITGATTVNAGFTLNAPSLTSGTVVVDAATNPAAPALPQPAGILNIGVGGITTTAGVTNAGLIMDAGSITGAVTSNTGTIVTTNVTGDVTNTNPGIFIATATPTVATPTIGGNLTNTGTILTTDPIIGPANTNPTFSIGGDLNMASGTLTVRDSGAVADEYLINGNASTLSGTVQVNILGGGKIGPTNFTIVDEPAGGLTVGTLTPSANTALFSYMLTSTPNTVILTVTQAPLTNFAQTPNQNAVANALDGSTSNIFRIFSLVPVSQGGSFFPAALDELSPESLQYARNIAFENASFLAQRMNSVDADLRGGYGGLDTSAISVVTPGLDSGLGRSLGSLLAYNDPAFHSSAPNGVNYYPGGSSSGSAPSSESSAEPTQTWDSSSNVISDSTSNPYLSTTNPAGPDTPRTSEFIAGDLILADLNQDHSGANAPTSKANYSAGDVTAGVSFRMTSHLAAGVLFDYNHTDADTDAVGSRTKIDSYSPGIFATYFDHGFYANGLFAFGYNQYTNTRKVFGNTAQSSPNGEQYTANVDFGYDFHPAKNWVVGPTLGLTYTHLDIDSFTETGASTVDDDLAVNSQSADSLRSRFGGHVIFQTNTGDVLLQPNLSLMWQHEYLDSSTGITSSFSDFGSSSFTINTAAPSRDSALIGLGLTATLSNSMALYLNYLADVGAEDYWAQSVVAGVKARF